MIYKKLSEQVAQLRSPQCSEAFVKRFQAAVREGLIDAVDLTGVRVELPQDFRRPGETEPKYKTVREMVFEVTPAFEAWFAEVNATLVPRVRKPKTPPVTWEGLVSGTLDFKRLAEEKRRNLEIRYATSQRVGQARSGKPLSRRRK